MFSQDFCARFWSKVDKSGGTDCCWLWTGYRHPDGHGNVKVSGRPWGAHRVSYVLHFGTVPDGMVVRHRCDNAPCVNPQHLELGSQLQNIRDRVIRGRGAVGERNRGGRRKAVSA